MEKDKKSYFNLATQFLLPAFTVLGFALTALKMPEYGLIASLISEVFWLYSGWKAWKEAGQIGIFITTLIITIIVSYGIVNYWFLH